MPRLPWLLLRFRCRVCLFMVLPASGCASGCASGYASCCAHAGTPCSSAAVSTVAHDTPRSSASSSEEPLPPLPVPRTQRAPAHPTAAKVPDATDDTQSTAQAETAAAGPALDPAHQFSATAATAAAAAPAAEGLKQSDRFASGVEGSDGKGQESANPGGSPTANGAADDEGTSQGVLTIDMWPATNEVLQQVTLLSWSISSP